MNECMMRFVIMIVGYGISLASKEHAQMIHIEERNGSRIPVRQASDRIRFDLTGAKEESA